jgi:hypothetical protein
MTNLARHMTEEDYARIGITEDAAKVFKSVEQGAATTVWAALTDHYEGNEGGQYLADVGECAPMRENPELAEAGYVPHAYDEAGEKALWKVSNEAVGVSD